MKCLKYLILVLFIAASSVAGGQINYAGKNFFVTAGGSNGTPYAGLIQVVMSSKHKATVNFHYYMNSIGGMPPTTYTIDPGTTVHVNFTTYQLWPISNIFYEQVLNRSLQITSDSNIVVQLLDRDGCADDGTFVLPTDQQKKARKYMLVSLSDRLMPSSHVSFSVVATCDSVVLEITPKCPTFSQAAGVPFQITLDKGDTYQLTTPGTAVNPLGPGRDLTGSTINVLYSEADVPINVFCHTAPIYCLPHTQTSFPVGCCADKLLEQLLPVDVWDTLAPVLPVYLHTQTRLKIVSAQNNNPVYFDNTYIGTLDQGGIIDTTIDRPLFVRTAKPAAVVKFVISDGYTALEDDGDPDMIWNLSPAQGIKESYFKLTAPLFANAIGSNGPLVDHVVVSMVSPDSLVNSIQLDGNNVASYFQSFPSAPGWQYAHVPIDSMDTVSTHHLTAPGKILAYLYKVYRQGGYSFNLSDANADSLAAVSSLVATYDSLSKCKGASITLSAKSDPPYTWSTGATGQTVTVTDTGTYWVAGTINYPCFSVPAVNYYHVIDTQQEVPAGNVIRDTIIKCQGKDVVLSASAALSYEWYNGSATQQLSVAETGMFYVKEVLTDAPCTRTVQIHEFYVTDFALDFGLGADTAACTGDHVDLISGIAGTMWSTGDTGKAIRVKETGIYSASYLDSCGYMHTDSISVVFDICPERYCTISFPSAFSPNRDGVNDVFRALTYGAFTSYYLAVYDRWGKLVFQTNNIKEGWNGEVGGVPAELGTYMFMCQVNCPAKGMQLLKGDVTLVR